MACKYGTCEKMRRTYKVYALIRRRTTRGGVKVSYYCSMDNKNIRTVSNIDSARLYTLDKAKQILKAIKEKHPKKEFVIERVV